MRKNKKGPRCAGALAAVTVLTALVLAGGGWAAMARAGGRSPVCQADGRLLFEEKGGEGEQEKLTLYAGAAVLMDADSGRVLYDKNGETPMPMASTTKIMTCIVALENGNLQDSVTASAYAAAQPKVRLGMARGREYRLEDLLYSMMLESHNDSAVAIAEHIGAKLLTLSGAQERTREESRQAVAAFAGMMNQKARDLGCFDTFFITPNGLDAQTEGREGKQRVHSTTARDLANIMRYCIGQSSARDKFLEITQTPAYSFTDLAGEHSCSCVNHNAFLQMMSGALSGKTGFTNDAGYCYVGALEQDGKCFTVALLACGWPGHKSWKWQDTKQLMNYGLEQYEFRSFETPEEVKEIARLPVTGGQAEHIDGQAYTQVELRERPFGLLMRPQENIEIESVVNRKLEAPVAAGQEVGSISYLVDGKKWKVDFLYAKDSVKERDFAWCLRIVSSMYLCGR